MPQLSIIEGSEVTEIAIGMRWNPLDDRSTVWYRASDHHNAIVNSASYTLPPRVGYDAVSGLWEDILTAYCLGDARSVRTVFLEWVDRVRVYGRGVCRVR